MNIIKDGVDYALQIDLDKSNHTSIVCFLTYDSENSVHHIMFHSSLDDCLKDAVKVINNFPPINK